MLSQLSIIQCLDELSTLSKISLGFLSVVLIANRKALFFGWHYRAFHTLFKHLIWRKNIHVEISRTGADSLFQPVIISTYNPLFECDFMMHKSNSTFYSDLDISRMHLLASLFKEVILPSGKPKHGLGKLNVVLGGVSCTFRREIKPFQKYEVWSRILAWDDKWIYIVSHFVKKGAVKPRRTGRSGQTEQEEVETMFSISEEQMQKVVLTSAISKYVFKRGRQTVSPAEVLKGLELVPAEENGRVKKTEAEGGSNWSWTEVQEERKRGLALAQHFAALDRLHCSLSGSSAPALGLF
ncbi:hypothetical protein AJ80_03704 [Polytolypa hystricis UAMH7299]|uniref:Thioesterase n=1 Tax=Polytolypa hystricis (strain UAMH7299) TaxID=1447883 RepID=A0A2B7Y7J9_POLH7|nr:hypothetical protein AJ80_03704 [Polytolypa hystricis UAMH7299]